MGECRFFLKPGENLEDGCIKNVYILGKDQALLIKAKETFTEGEKTTRSGDKWMVRGPVRYTPSIQVEVLEVRENITLDKNEGIYVRDTRSGRGEVRLI